jgi:hypothetical protein
LASLFLKKVNCSYSIGWEDGNMFMGIVVSLPNHEQEQHPKMKGSQFDNLVT